MRVATYTHYPCEIVSLSRRVRVVSLMATLPSEPTSFWLNLYTALLKVLVLMLLSNLTHLLYIKASTH